MSASQLGFRERRRHMKRERRLGGLFSRRKTNVLSDQRTDDFSTHVLGFLAGERRCQPTRDDIHKNRLGLKSFDSRLQQLRVLDTLNEAHIGTGVGGQLQSKNGLVHTENLC